MFGQLSEVQERELALCWFFPSDSGRVYRDVTPATEPQHRRGFLMPLRVSPLPVGYYTRGLFVQTSNIPLKRTSQHLWKLSAFQACEGPHEHHLGEPSQPSPWEKDSLPSPPTDRWEADTLRKWRVLKERTHDGGPESPSF